MGNYAVIGYPISHTLSPLIHNANFEAKGTDDNYAALAVSPDQLHMIRDIIGRKALSGLNVTIPHKEKIMHHLDRVDPDAERIGAVNTVAVEEGGLVGYNTDITGYMNAFLEQFGEGKRNILIIGAGGAAKAVHRAHLNAGDEVTIAARRLESFGQFKTKDFTPVLLPELESGMHYNVIVNATPVGMKGEDLFETLGIPSAIAGSETIGVDLIYNPRKTVFLEYFETDHFMNGMPMLIHQAMDAYTIWTGEQGDHKAVNKKYEEHVGGQS